MGTLFGLRLGTKPVGVVARKPVNIGTWKLTVRPTGGAPVDLFFFRGLPSQLASFELEDPFGPSTMSFTVPGITIFDRLGQGDLKWVEADADVDLVYIGSKPAGYPFGDFAWEGFISTWDWNDGGLTVSCQGAMHQVDLEKAKPLFPSRPLPYEVAIAHCFAARPYLRTTVLHTEFPTWWKKLYAAPRKGTPSYMIPTGISAGDKWTGLLTRATGQWDDMLTGYIQSLLVSMYTERGRWTLDLDRGRIPVLRHRDMHFETSASDIVIDPAQPGVKISLSADFTQSLNVVYGSGQSLSGVGYSGMQVSSDGTSTSYLPLAAARQVEPVSDKNGWFKRSKFRREVVLELQPGLDENDAAKVGAAHLARFSDPGVTGTVSLQTDPMIGGQVLPRHLIRPGMTCRLPNAFGSRDGVLLHIARVSHDFGSDTTTLTVDSKYRDALTLDEVMLRGRDALSISRQLVSGSYQPPIPDQLLPWDYSAGSGFIPGGQQLSSLRLFKGMPNTVLFPWTDWTTRRPPKAAAWRSSYIRIGPASVNANNNWAALSDSAGTKLGIPIRAAQAGTIRLLQIAAYDLDGNVMPVDFHVSFYYSRGVNALSMPSMPSVYESAYPPYKGGQRYPFFPNAWEQYNADGTLANPATANAVQTAGLIRAYGSAYEKAGHYPGSSASGDPATGLLVDESQWSFDCTHFDSNFDPYSPTKNKTNQLAGMIYAMIWCDQQRSESVYFAGRLFRVEPGTGS